MKLTYYAGDPPNFGDEINATMWDHLLPKGFLDDAEDELFLGIGSILWDSHPREPRKIVAGSGFGGYTPPPDLKDGKWEILWVRGPYTAKVLGIDPSLAIADAAVLVRATPLPASAKHVDVAFMPHVDSLSRGAWAEVCAAAGMTFLDPRAPVDQLLAQIRGARLVITEAMHGAIISDALRTPWIAALPLFQEHRAKWDDWASSLDIPLNSVRLNPSSLREAWIAKTRLRAEGRRSQMVLDTLVAQKFDQMMVQRAAARLLHVARTVTPQLSTDAAIARATGRALDVLNRFVARRSHPDQRMRSLRA
jgi:succinoglycan biosynthesis protein ExoV